VQEDVAVIKADFDAPCGARATFRRVGDDDSGQIACRFIVDASGQSSVIARQLGLRKIDEDFRFMSVWGYFHDSRYVAADGQIHPASSLSAVPPTTYVSSVAGTGDWGWCWHIPLRERTSIGLVLPVESVKAVRGNQAAWTDYLLRQCRAMPRMRELLAEARLGSGSVSVIRDYSYRSTRLAGPGFFLVGDAAGFVDPIFSVGLVLAMYSARAATWAIDRSFKTPERLAAHQSMYAAQLTSRIELSRALALPRYELLGEATRDAKRAIQFTDARTCALIEAASKLTARSLHYQALVDEPVQFRGRS
jgi:flavin-dependent dehydrogenase